MTCITHIRRMVVVGVCGVLLAWSAAGAQSVSTLLEKAVYQEQTAGDLDAAMRIYRQVAGDSRASRPVAAQALYRLGLCQIKKKQTDAAAESFRKVVAQYPDQKDLVEQANKQLASGGGGGNGKNDNGAQRRSIGKNVSAFPEQPDLSTPEGAAAAWNRASGKMDAQALAGVNWYPMDSGEMDRIWNSPDKQGLEIYNKAQLNAVIVEVWTYKDDLAMAVCYLSFPPGKGRAPYSLRYLGQANGQWKNFGEDRVENLNEARETFKRKMGPMRDRFVQMQTGLAAASQPGVLKDVTVRDINKTVPEFPEAVDLTTPEGACVAWQRANACMDAKAISELSLAPIDPQQEQQFFERLGQEDPKSVYLTAVANSKVVTVLTYKDDLAEVITYLPFPSGEGRDPYSGRGFSRVNGQWKNIGEDRFPSVEMAIGRFSVKKDTLWKHAQGLLGKQGQDSASVPAGRQRAIQQVLLNPEPIVKMAKEIFEAIRTAEYDRWLSGEGWGSFPLTQYYQTYQWYDVLVPWICKTFKADPIQDVWLGQVLANADGLPTIPYRLILKSGRVLEGSLPFDLNGEGEWYAKWGLDWHLPNGMNRTTAKARQSYDPQAKVTTRTIDKPVSVFAAGDLSTPESAAANYCRASGNMDAKALATVSVAPVSPEEFEKARQRGGKDLEVYNQAQLDATVVEVLVYREALARAIVKLNFPPGVGRHPYSGRSFGLFGGVWKNMGEDRYPSVEAARAAFEKGQETAWDNYLEMAQGQGGGATGGSDVYRSGGNREDIDAHQREAEQHPEMIEAEARSFFEAIRTADYGRWLARKDRFTLPLGPIGVRYETYTDWPRLALWVSTTFQQNPIVDVQVGKAFRNSRGLMTVHYKLTLKDGVVLEGDLPFYWEVDHWHGKQGIDWHLKYKGKPLGAGRADGPCGAVLGNASADTSSPEATIRGFMQAAVAGNVQRAMSYVRPDSHDYDDIRAILTNTVRASNPFARMFAAIDPQAPVEIVKVQRQADAAEIVWRVKFARSWSVQEHGQARTFQPGETFDLDGNLKKVGDGWLIDRI